MIPVDIREERVYLSQRLSMSIQRAEFLRAFEKEPPHNLGALPLHRVNDYSQFLPPIWRKEGGIFVPLLPDEAVWLGFAGRREMPNAVKIRLDDVNTVTGKLSQPGFHVDMQDYLVCPPQLHWDGVRGHEMVEQFAAPILTMGGGIFKTLRVTVYEPLPGVNFREHEVPASGMPIPLQALSNGPASREFSAVIPDPYGADTWDENSGTTLSVHFVDPALYESATGEVAPPPVSPKDVFTRYRLP